MNPFVGPALGVAVLAWAGTGAQSVVPTVHLEAAATALPVTPSGSPEAAPSGSPAPTGAAVGTPPAVEPSSSPASSASIPPAALPGGTTGPATNGSPAGAATPAAPGPAGSGPSPAASAPSAIPSGRFHLHRPGTDVDGDLLTGSLASHVFVLKGNVTLHSDPKIDREMAEASESDEPLTVTADEIDVDQVTFTYVAKGHMHFVQGSRSGTADLATLNEEAHTLDLVGNATVLDGDHRTTAAKMHYNTFDKQFIGAGDVRIYAPLPTPNPSASKPPPKHKLRLPL